MMLVPLFLLHCSSDLALSAIFRDVSKTVYSLWNVKDLDFTFWVKKKDLMLKHRQRSG